MHLSHNMASPWLGTSGSLSSSSLQSSEPSSSERWAAWSKPWRWDIAWVGCSWGRWGRVLATFCLNKKSLNSSAFALRPASTSKKSIQPQATQGLRIFHPITKETSAERLRPTGVPADRGREPCLGPVGRTFEEPLPSWPPKPHESHAPRISWPKPAKPSNTFCLVF